MFPNFKRILKNVALFNLVVLSILIFNNVSFAEIGRLSISKKVEAAFENYKSNPKYTYYYVNQESNPCAVIGLRKDYSVHDLTWIKVSPDSDDFKKVIELVRRFPMAGSPAFGAHITDSKGDIIGEYYSTAGAGVTLNKETKSIMLTIFMSGSHHN